RWIAGFSAARFFQDLFLPAVSLVVRSPLDAASAEFSTGEGITSGSSCVVDSERGSAGGSSVASSTLATASVSSGSTSVSVTSESPIGGRLAVPLKIQSDIRSARSILWLCSPSTQEIASTTFDFRPPLGPTMHVIPLPLNVIGVFSQNDLKPSNSTFRSFSTRTLAQFAPLASSAGEASVESSSGGVLRQQRWKGRYEWPCRLALRIGGYGNKT